MNYTKSSLGYSQLTSLASSTLISSVTGGIPAGTESVLLQCETNNVKYRDDGGTPTATVGMLLIANTIYEFTVAQIASMRVIEVTASAKINITFYGTRA